MSETTAVVGPDGTWALPAGSGPCRTWPVQPGCGCLPASPADWDTQMRHAVEVASEILWLLTAGRYGLCHELLRPCVHEAPPRAPSSWDEVPAPGAPLVHGCGCPPSHGRCSCACSASELALPGPVHWDHDTYHPRVWVDGEELPTDRFRVLDGWLIRTDRGSWPSCQNMAGEIGAPGVFAVSYWRGIPVPPGGRRAAAQLACEVWRACARPDSCKLPRRVNTIRREGVTFTMLDPMEFLGDGKTGLTEVDLWLSAVNPYGVRSPSTVFSPDQPRFRSDRGRGAGWLR